MSPPAERGVARGPSRSGPAAWKKVMNMRTTTALVLAALVLGTGCKRSSANETVTAEPEIRGPKTVKFDPRALERLGVKVDVAGSAAKDYTFDVVGTLDYNYDNYAEIGSIADGRITQIFFRVGERVKKGQVLATLLVPDVAQAQAMLASANASATIAEGNRQRETSLLEKDLTTAREAEVAKGEAIRTSAELSAAQARLAAMGAGSKSSTSRVTGGGGLALISPLNGVVVRRDAVLGKFIQANMTAFIVADTSELRAAINVYENDLPYFKLGAEVEIRVDAHPGTILRGKVFLVEPAVGKQSRALRALITVPNENNDLLPGEFVRASVKLPETQNTNLLFVPAAAVQPLGEDDVVFVEREAGLFEVRKVRVERQTAEVAAIGDGLSHGERIVVAGAFLLRGEVSKQ